MESLILAAESAGAYDPLVAQVCQAIVATASKRPGLFTPGTAGIGQK